MKNKWTKQEIGVDNQVCIMCNGAPVTVDAVIVKLNMQEETIAELAWPEDCEHSYIDAQGVGGGNIFKYCNKCGRTK